MKMQFLEVCLVPAEAYSAVQERPPDGEGVISVVGVAGEEEATILMGRKTVAEAMGVEAAAVALSVYRAQGGHDFPLTRVAGEASPGVLELLAQRCALDEKVCFLGYTVKGVQAEQVRSFV